MSTHIPIPKLMLVRSKDHPKCVTVHINDDPEREHTVSGSEEKVLAVIGEIFPGEKIVECEFI